MSPIYNPRTDTTKAMKGRYISWDSDEPVSCPVWPSGNPFVDWALGIPGIPRGRVVECYGPESSGKSTLGLQVAAYVYETLGIPSVYVDAEDTFDAVYAKQLGCTKEGLLLEVPETLEDFLEGWDVLLTKMPPLALVIVDSVAALRTQQDLKNAAGDDRTAGMNRARIWTQALATNTHRLNQAGHTLFLVNQERTYIDTTPGFTPPGVAAMLPKTRTPGGRGIKFYASLRIAFEPSSEIKVEGTNPITLEAEKQVVGRNVWMKVVKNKVAPPPWRKMRLQIRDGIGFNLTQNLLDFGQVHGFVKRATGAKWTLLDQEIQGDANAFQLARQPEMEARLVTTAIAALDAATLTITAAEALAADYDEDAPEVAAALEALSTIGSGNAALG